MSTEPEERFDLNHRVRLEAFKARIRQAVSKAEDRILICGRSHDSLFPKSSTRAGWLWEDLFERLWIKGVQVDILISDGIVASLEREEWRLDKIRALETVFGHSDDKSVEAWEAMNACKQVVVHALTDPEPDSIAPKNLRLNIRLVSSMPIPYELVLVDGTHLFIERLLGFGRQFDEADYYGPAKAPFVDAVRRDFESYFRVAEPAEEKIKAAILHEITEDPGSKSKLQPALEWLESRTRT